MSEYTQEDLKRSRQWWKDQPAQSELRFIQSIAKLIAQVRAEAQQAFSAECGRFHNEGPKCATCGRSDRDARLAAAEKLAQTASKVPEPEDGDVCEAGCGVLDLVKEEVLLQSGEKYLRYFFKHKNCWYGRLRAALAEWEGK